MAKQFLKKILPPEILTSLRKMRVRIFGLLYKKNLSALAEIHQSDKWGKHYYTPHYQKHFHSFRDNKIKLLEIGVGGNKSPTYGGASLRMWKDYFRKANIFGIDIYDKSALEENRIKIFKGSQADEDFLKKVAGEIGGLDIVIDDGSHINDHIITSFKTLFPYLKNGGIYVVEDVQTSYWEFFGGSSENFDYKGTAMNFFKDLTDGINHKEFIREGYTPSYFDKNITSIHFYHSLIIINKGTNNEPSSYLVNNKIPNRQ